jgi:hypothetical protein
MVDSWGLYTEDLDTDEERAASFLPSSMRDVVTDSTHYNSERPRDTQKEGSGSKVRNNQDLAKSLPSLAVFNPHPLPSRDQRSAGGESRGLGPVMHFRVKFHVKRIQICSVESHQRMTENMYVITEADRGQDLGLIIAPAQAQDAVGQRAVHKIVRRASDHEVAMLSGKRSKEEEAISLCQTIVAEQRFNMQITDAELQFDGTQLTFYYSANRYIDFRSLVRVLFRTFGTRIWMVWYEGESPVKDVFSQHERRRHRDREKRHSTDYAIQ